MGTADCWEGGSKVQIHMVVQKIGLKIIVVLVSDRHSIDYLPPVVGIFPLTLMLATMICGS